MESGTQRVRFATLEDCPRIGSEIGSSLAKAAGKGRRSNHTEGVLRNEVLLQERYDRKEATWKLLGFVEWHTRLDGTTTIRDVGTTGEEPDTAVVKSLIRQLIINESPGLLRVKTRADQDAWNRIFDELPGFVLDGKEFVRPCWRNIWVRSRQRS